MFCNRGKAFRALKRLPEVRTGRVRIPALTHTYTYAYTHTCTLAHYWRTYDGLVDTAQHLHRPSVAPVHAPFEVVRRDLARGGDAAAADVVVVGDAEVDGDV